MDLRIERGRQTTSVYDQQVEAGLRLRCVVPGCRCTTKARGLEGEEWICGKHWSTVDHDRRKLWSDLKRRITRTGGSPKTDAMFWRHWQRLKRQAIDRALGL